jgi:hypothetical protein
VNLSLPRDGTSNQTGQTEEGGGTQSKCAVRARLNHELGEKINTERVLPVGPNIETFGHPSKYLFCDSTEDELHLFVFCSRVSQLRAWLDAYLLTPHFSRCSDRLTLWEKLVGLNKNDAINYSSHHGMESISC